MLFCPVGATEQNKYMKKYFVPIVILLTIAHVAPAQSLRLWYDKPAQKWTDALPIGNGYMGAMIYGDPLNEHIQFNESTLWSGGPHEYQHNGAVKYLPTIRQLLWDGKQPEAEALAEKEFMGAKYPDEKEYEVLKAAWIKKVTPATQYAAPGYNDANWKTMHLPYGNGWENSGIEGLAGLDAAMWLRTSFEVPEQWAGKNLWIDLGRIRDADITYINGTKIGTTDGMNENRHYAIPASLLKKGRNVIAVQVLNYFDKGGFTGARGGQKAFIIYPEDGWPANSAPIPVDWKYWIQDNDPPIFPRYEADYQPFGDLWLQLQEQGQPITDYRRELDIENAVSTVSYKSKGVQFTRSYWASFANPCIVMKLSASKPGNITLKALLKTPHQQFSVRRVDDHTLALSLKVRNGVLKGECYLQVLNEGGQVMVSDSAIELKQADKATFLLVAATSFKNYKDASLDPDSICKVRIKQIHKNLEKGFSSFRKFSRFAYQYDFMKFKVDFGHTAQDSLPTDQRIDQFSATKDPALMALYMQYGRYLLISSSRPGTQAANLQGIWNDLITPPWGSKYTTNINLQMNYWPAELLNLSAYTEPLFRLTKEVAEAGALTAKEHYGAPGWVLHHNTDLWRGTAPINASNHGIWVSGAPWLCLHLWEHYQFTQDKKFLQQQAYPLMRSAAAFFTQYLVKDPATGWLISTPSNSPEQGGLVAGPTMDHQIIRELFKNTIKAAQLLNTDAALQKVWQEKYQQIAPNQIGKYGQLQEWVQDRDDTANKHRHQSHLWGVFPGTDITWDKTPDMMKAARQSLLYRGDGGTGWSLAWKVNLWARFKDGDHTLLMAERLLASAEGNTNEGGGVYHNLFDAHPPFQIDGNFGGAAGMAEMLLQSHMGYIELLPALPTALPTGNVRGLCARGGFEVSMQWKEGQLQQATIYSKAGGPCTIKYNNKTITLQTKKGQAYTLNGSLIRK
jgi:alpha-L-fucosidase 2